MLGALSLGLFCSLPLFAQEQKPEEDETLSILKEIEEIKKGQAEIRKEIEEIKKLLLARPVSPPAPAAAAQPNVENLRFHIGGNPIRGESTASLVLIEFTDYQ